LRYGSMKLVNDLPKEKSAGTAARPWKALLAR
jgi:hypothetical protein